MVSTTLPAVVTPGRDPARRGVVAVGTGLAIAAGTAFFGGLLGLYFATQDVSGPWLPDDTSLPNVPLLVTYATLLMSVFTAQWAVAAVRLGDRNQLGLAVGVTILLAAAFFNGLSFSWSQLGVGPGDNLTATAVYAVTGAHALAVLAAVITFLVMGFRALGGQFGPRNAEFVQSAAATWHWAVAMGVAVWVLVWFLEGMPRG